MLEYPLSFFHLFMYYNLQKSDQLESIHFSNCPRPNITERNKLMDFTHKHVCLFKWGFIPISSSYSAAFLIICHACYGIAIYAL